MKARSINWPQKVMVCLVLTLIAALCFSTASAWAESAKATTVKVKITSSGPPATKMEVGDDPSHTLNLGKGSGTAVFSDGKKAQYQSVSAWDSYLGWFAKGWGYGKFTFQDGSWILTKWQSEWTLKSDKAGNPIFKGAGNIIKGGGDYQGIGGTYTSSFRWLPPSKDHLNGIVEAEHVWTYTMASKQ